MKGNRHLNQGQSKETITQEPGGRLLNLVTSVAGRETPVYGLLFTIYTGLTCSTMKHAKQLDNKLKLVKMQIRLNELEAVF